MINVQCKLTAATGGVITSLGRPVVPSRSRGPGPSSTGLWEHVMVDRGVIRTRRGQSGILVGGVYDEMLDGLNVRERQS